MNRKTNIITILILISITIVSCSKKDNSKNYKNGQECVKPSLAEFVNSLESPYDVSFLKNAPIIDNTFVFENFKENTPTFTGEVFEKIKIKIKFGAVDCKGIGICIIVIFATEDANAEAIINGKNYTIILTDDEGITSDGYLPVLRDMQLSENLTIKAGIYKANYDRRTNRYNAITLNLK